MFMHSVFRFASISVSHALSESDLPILSYPPRLNRFNTGWCRDPGSLGIAEMGDCGVGIELGWSCRDHYPCSSIASRVLIEAADSLPGKGIGSSAVKIVLA